MQDIDREILRKAAAGDLQAFEEIYKALSSFVYRVAYRVVQNVPDAEEVTQDVFLKIHDHLRDFQERAALSTWAYRITVNTALNYAKKSNRERNRRDDFDNVIATQSVAPRAGEKMEQEGRQAQIQEILEVLNPEQRACLVLRELEGMDYQQIAKTLQININTVRTRLKRARDKLLERARKGAIPREL